MWFNVAMVSGHTGTGHWWCISNQKAAYYLPTHHQGANVQEVPRDNKALAGCCSCGRSTGQCLSCCTGVIATTDFAVAAHDVSIAVLCGGVPKRGSGLMTKVQLMAANCAIYRDQAAALAAHAAPGVKVRPHSG